VSVASDKTMLRATVMDGIERLAAQSVEGFIVIAPQREAFARSPGAARHARRRGRGAERLVGTRRDVDPVKGGGSSRSTFSRRHPRCGIGGPSTGSGGGRGCWRAVLTEAGIEPPPVLRGDWTADPDAP
jgi:hypothetical protein